MTEMKRVRDAILPGFQKVIDRLQCREYDKQVKINEVKFFRVG